MLLIFFLCYEGMAFDLEVECTDPCDLCSYTITFNDDVTANDEIRLCLTPFVDMLYQASAGIAFANKAAACIAQFNHGHPPFVV